jgi:hypothetical protein
MKILFDKLFEIEFYHEYYKSKLSDDFLFAPTSTCRRMLQKYGLLSRATPQCLAVFYEAEEDDSKKLHPVRPIKEDVRFSFVLKIKTPFLLNYSDLPLDLPSDHIYYLNNLIDNQQNQQLLLSSNKATEFVSSQDALKLRPQLFQYVFNTPKDHAEFEILDEWSQVVKRERKTVVEGVLSYEMDVRGVGPGKYTLKIDGEQKEQFYASDEIIGNEVFAVVDILHHGSVPQPYMFTDPNANHDASARTYAVKIDRRKTFWKYYFVLKYRLSDLNPADWPKVWPPDWPQSLPVDWPAGWPQDWPKDWSIVYPPDPAVKIIPSPQEMKTLFNGTMAIPFVSDTPLPLQQEPVKGIRLEKKAGSNNGSGIREIDHLPNPSITSIVPDVSGGNVYSEVYVYV